MSRFPVVLALTFICAGCARAGPPDWGDWGDQAGPLGDDKWWEGDGDGGYPPHGGPPGKVPSWLWFFGQGKAGLDGRDGLVGDTGEKGDCGVMGEEGRGARGDPGMPGMEGDTGEMGANGTDGCQGDKGNTGDPGPDAMDSGVSMPATRLYTRWGRTTCPAAATATTVYSGRAATSYHNNAGAGANLVCMSDTFATGLFDPVDMSASTTFGSIVGVEYQILSIDPLHAVVEAGNNVPCAVCSVDTNAVYVQPGLTSCPDTWTVQYSGYLMAEQQTGNSDRPSENYRSHYVCVDKDAEAVDESLLDPAHGEANLAHVSVDCASPLTTGSGIFDCTPVSYGMGQIACVVCSKD